MEDCKIKCYFCTVCGIKMDNGVFYYSHNNTLVSPEDLAGVVCNNIMSNPEKYEKCINPQKGNTTGDSFKKRLEFLNK